VGFVDQDGRPIRDPDELGRLRGLVIPPAWRDVWISPDPGGHIQATGIDAAGRKQYLYHRLWRVRQDEAKFDHVLEVAARLPALRERVGADLSGRGLGRERVLATVASLLDSGTFRIGGDQYAAGDAPTFGVATLRPEHTRPQRGCVVFEFPAKGGIARVQRIDDAGLCAVLRDLRKRRSGADRLFGYWDGKGWRDVRSDEINEYLRAASGGEMTAKDFRTWHATLRTSCALARLGPERSETRRKRAVAGVMREVAELLGNTPAVARASYVHPRLIDRYHDGQMADIDPTDPPEAIERAVIEFLSD
jgi:DNA topoisomerase IB